MAGRQSCIETIEDLKKYMNLTPDEEAGVAKTCLGKLRMASYSLLPVPDSSPDDPLDPVRLHGHPHRRGAASHADYEDADPLHEDDATPLPPA